MTFYQNVGLTFRCISLDRSFFHSSHGFIMISCMSDLLECEIQRLGASLFQDKCTSIFPVFVRTVSG